jgi:hypothetical protein
VCTDNVNNIVGRQHLRYDVFQRVLQWVNFTSLLTSRFGKRIPTEILQNSRLNCIANLVQKSQKCARNRQNFTVKAEHPSDLSISSEIYHIVRVLSRLMNVSDEKTARLCLAPNLLF